MDDAKIKKNGSGGDIRTAIGQIALYCMFASSALFIPRGDWKWIEGWLFIFLFAGFLISAFVPMAANPYLLKARVSWPFRRRQPPLDKAIFLLLSSLHLSWILGIGLEDRVFGGGSGFGILWESIGGLVFILSIVCIHAIVSGNPFLIPAVEHQENHRIVVDGIYARVRHPMYATVSAMSFGGSLLTSSIIGLIVSAMILAVFWWRLVLEERFLLMKFPEYASYMREVKYRLFPLLL